MKFRQLLFAFCLIVTSLWIGQPAAGAPVVDTGASTRYLPVIQRGFEFGFSTLYGIEADAYLPEQGADTIVDAGAHFVRKNSLSWEDVEPQPGQRNWAALAGFEAEMSWVSSQGLSAVVVIRSAPSWARQDGAEYSNCGPIRADRLDDFAFFMRDVVARYSAAPYNVQYWEIWNEPDVELNPGTWNYGCWGVPGDPYYGGRYYGEMLKIVYPQIKAANPQAQLLTGGLLLGCSPDLSSTCTPGKFLEGILISGAGSSFDGVNYHAYDYYQFVPGNYFNPEWQTHWNTTGPVNLAKVKFLRSVLNRYGYGSKPIYNTETSLLCVEAGHPNIAKCDGDYDRTKANYIAQVYAQTLASGQKMAVWYDLHGSWRQNGLVTNGAENLGFTAFQFSRSQLGRASFVKDVTASGVTGYEFQAGARKIWVVWATNGSATPLALASQPALIFDAAGQPLAVSQNLSLDWNVRYIIW